MVLGIDNTSVGFYNGFQKIWPPLLNRKDNYMITNYARSEKEQHHH
jgi:hypothetical protein